MDIPDEVCIALITHMIKGSAIVFVNRRIYRHYIRLCPDDTRISMQTLLRCITANTYTFTMKNIYNSMEIYKYDGTNSYNNTIRRRMLIQQGNKRIILQRSCEQNGGVYFKIVSWSSLQDMSDILAILCEEFYEIYLLISDVGVRRFS